MNRKLSILALAATAGLIAATTHAAPTSYATNFDSMTVGSIYGQEGWANLNPSYTYVQGVTTDASHSSDKSWLLSSKNNDGTVCTIEAPEFEPVGESNTVFGGHPAYNQFHESFWFRSVKTSDDPNLYVSNSAGTAASVRNTWVGVVEDSGNLYVQAAGVDVGGNFSESPSTPALNWGDWYQVKEDAIFVDGPNNDQVRYQVLDSIGNVLMDATIDSWENYYATDNTAEQSPGPVASNRVTWGLHASGTDQGIYIDDFAESVSVPEPTTIGLLGVSTMGLLARRRAKSHH